MKTQWYVVYFRGHGEKKLAETLSRRNIESYFPVTKVIQHRAADSKVVEQPLFSSYLFVRTTEKLLPALKKIPAVINVVYWLGKPVIVTDHEVNMLKRFLADRVNVKTEKITMGEVEVKKVANPVIEEENSFKIINQNIHIILPSLGYKITADVEISNVRIISSNNLINKYRLRTAKLFNPVHIFNNF